MRIHRMLLVVALLAVLLLLVAASAYGLPLLQVPEVSHPTERREKCLLCHDTGKVRPFPADHEGRDVDTCLGCHQVPAAEQPAELVPEMPHPTEGREKCLLCHDTGKVRPFPADHEGHDVDTCLGCHQVPADEQPAELVSEVPHPTKGREKCLLCHDTGKVRPFPADHEGRDVDTCLGCHQVPGAEQPVEQAPEVPHPTEEPENCLACHETGKVKPFPADHEGLGNESCLGCHQTGGVEEPAPAPTLTATPSPLTEVLPTPILEPPIPGENTCISCHEGLGGKHAQITMDWAESVHAAPRVGCVSCHGGDPTQTDAGTSMSADAGFLGPLPKERIPGLCGSCHSRAVLMRASGLPTDQFDQYWQSRHGQALLEGDQNVPTCFDCHGGHRVLEVSDPASKVYPTNDPRCARLATQIPS